MFGPCVPWHAAHYFIEVATTFFWKSMSIFRSPTDRQLDQSSVLARVGCWVLVGDNGREGAGIRLEAVDFVTIVF